MYASVEREPGHFLHLPIVMNKGGSALMPHCKVEIWSIRIALAFMSCPLFLGESAESFGCIFFIFCIGGKTNILV